MWNVLVWLSTEGRDFRISIGLRTLALLLISYSKHRDTGTMSPCSSKFDIDVLLL